MGNIVIKYFVWQLVRKLLKSINTGDIFKAVMTASLQKANITFNRKHFHPKNC